MKVVINRCFGGFSVSEAAARQMAAAGSEEAAKCIAAYEAELAAFARYKQDGAKAEGVDSFSARMFDINIEYGSMPSFYGHMSETERNDSHLVAAVEALGSEANGDHAKLTVVEIPDGTDYEISDYDGMEHIAEKHRTWS